MPTNQPSSQSLVSTLSQAAAKLGAALFVLVAFAILYEVISVIPPKNSSDLK